MGKKNEKTEQNVTAEKPVETPVATPVETPVVKPFLSATEFTLAIAALAPSDLATLQAAVKTSANVKAGTIGKYKMTETGEQKRSKIDRLIPEYTPPRGSVLDRFDVTDVQERWQLARIIQRGGWLHVVRQRAIELRAKKGAPLTDSEIDRIVASNGAPKAWSPNGLQRKRPSYQRVLSYLVDSELTRNTPQA